MLSDNDAIATVMENDEVLAFKSGATTLFVYRSPYAGTNKATAVTFVSEEVDDLVRILKGRGVTFEHYDLPKVTRHGDIHVAGSMRTAWFKDPDGNIFSVVTPPNRAERETAAASARSAT